MKNLLKSIMIIILLSTALPIFSQEAEISEPETIYSDILFNEYVELETRILQKYEDGSLDHYNLGEIERQRVNAVKENRKDVISRLDMLSFVVKSGLDDQSITEDADKVRFEIASVANKYRAETANAIAIKKAANVSISTAIASGTIFALSAMISNEYYNKYTQTELADQAAFYLFWWQFLERVSFAGAITTVISGTAAGILTALY